ncbi:MAG: aminotransferase class IV [Bacteriovoracia bacterium]
MLVNINGHITEAAQAKIQIFDRGFLYGDSLYEVMRTQNGKLFQATEHLRRLAISAQLCRMTLNQTNEEYVREMNKTLEAFHRLPGMARAEAYVRLIVTRGVGEIGFGLKSVKTPSQFVIIVKAQAPLTDADFERGLTLQVSQRLRNDRRALDPAMKSGNYLNSLLAFLEAEAEGYNDSLMANAEGHLTEGTTFNIFYVNRGIIATPPLDIGILDGITRLDLIRVAKKLDIPVREVRFPKARLYEADEVFISSTLRGAFPVVRVDKHPIGRGALAGKPGPVTRRLSEAYRQFSGT